MNAHAPSRSSFRPRGPFGRGALVAALALALGLPAAAGAAGSGTASAASLLASPGTGSPVSVQNHRAFLPKVFAVASARPLEAA